MKKNVASQVVGAQLVSKADGSPVTTGTTTVSVTGDGGTQATGSVGSGAATHEGNGYWTYAPAQAETNYDLAAFTFVNTSAINTTVQIYTSFPQTGDNYARTGAPAGASIAADIAAVKSETASIQSDTNDIQTRLPAALTADGNMKADSLRVGGTLQTAKDLGASATQTGDSFTRIGAGGAGLTALGDTRIANLDAAVSSRGTSTLTSANVSTAIVNALTVDTYAQPAAVPAATASLKNMIGWLYTLGRNRVTQSATEQKLYADDGTTLIATSTDSDDGTTTTRGKFT